MIKVYEYQNKTVDRFTVIINGQIYIMSDNANMPNGVNIYMGPEVHENGKFNPEAFEKPIVHELPEGLLKAIVNNM